MLGWTLIIAGFLAALPYLCSKLSFLGGIDRFFRHASWYPNFQIILGLACTIFGAYKLIVPDWPRTMFVGDLIPAVASILVGLLFAMGFLRKQGSLPQEQIESLNRKLIAYQFPIGIMAMIFGFIHIFMWTSLGSKAFF